MLIRKLLSMREQGGFTSLFVAAQEGHAGAVQALLGAGVNPDAGHTGTVQALLGAGVNPEAEAIEDEDEATVRCHARRACAGGSGIACSRRGSGSIHTDHQRRQPSPCCSDVGAERNGAAAAWCLG